MKPLRNSIIALLLGTSFLHAAESTLLYEEEFSKTLRPHAKRLGGYDPSPAEPKLGGGW